MKFKDWIQLKEIVNGGMGTEPLQSPMVNLSLGNNTALHGLISTEDLPPTRQQRTDYYMRKTLPPENRPAANKRKIRKERRRFN